MSELSDEQRKWITGPDARMEGYYIGFERTGNELVDQILSAVAYAGKGAHSTDAWVDELPYAYGPVPEGETLNWLIQEAANDAAKRLARVRAEAQIDALRWAAEHLSDGLKYEDIANVNSWEAVTVCSGILRDRADRIAREKDIEQEDEG